MTVLYESTRLPTNFIRVDVGKSFPKGNASGVDVPYPMLGTTRNGARATALSMFTIMENEHWLAMADCPTVQFFEYGAEGTSWTGATRTVDITVPPYCRWVEFYFLASRKFSSTGDRLSYIQVDSSVHSVVNTNIPYGEDLGTGKLAVSYETADWVKFSGVDVEETGSATAVRLYADATQHDRWALTTVTVEVSANVDVYAAAYRVIPALSPLQYQA